MTRRPGAELREYPASMGRPADLRWCGWWRNFCRVRATDTDPVFTDWVNEVGRVARQVLSPKSRALCPRPSWDRLEQLPSMLSGVLPVGVGCVRVL